MRRGAADAAAAHGAAHHRLLPLERGMRKARIGVGRVVYAVDMGVDDVEAESHETVAGIENGNVVDLKEQLNTFLAPEFYLLQ